MRKSVKLSVVAIIAAIGLSACTPVTGSDYSGEAVVVDTIKGKRSCNVVFTTEDGTEKNVFADSKGECWRIQEGSTIIIKNGKIQK